MENRKYDAIVVGSGVGGLSAAICLSMHGKKVLVLEQHDVPGGWSHSFMLNKQKFSPGVHYIGQLGKGEATHQMYCDLGLAKDLIFFKMNKNAFEHCYVGEHLFNYPSGFENIKDAFKKRFPEEEKNIEKYLKLVNRVNYQIQIFPTIRGFWQQLTAPFRTKHVGKYALFSLKKVIHWHVKDNLLKAFLNVQCGDHGLPPSRASFPIHCAIMGHYFNGGYYPKNGGGGIVKAMTNKIKSLGSEVLVNHKVKKILIEDKKAVGVKLFNDEIVRANVVISNADPHITYKKLIGEEYLGKRLRKKLNKTKYSCSSVMMFLTLEIDSSLLNLDSGNYWIIKNEEYDAHFEELTKNDLTVGDIFPALFLSCTTLKDPSSYDGKHHNFEVITYVDYDSVSEFSKNKNYHTKEYESFKNKLREKFFNTIEKVIPNVRNHVVTAEIGTPLTNKYYINSTNGNVYGTEKTIHNIGPFAFKNKSPIKNLYLCGSSTLSHGVSGATSSGINTAANILNLWPEDVLPKSDEEIEIIDAEDKDSWPDWVYKKRNIRSKRSNQ